MYKKIITKNKLWLIVTIIAIGEIESESIAHAQVQPCSNALTQADCGNSAIYQAPASENAACENFYGSGVTGACVWWDDDSGNWSCMIGCSNYKQISRHGANSTKIRNAT